jgi:hypothetical protein
MAVAVVCQTASAKRAAPAGLAHRVAAADVVFVGKVTAVEDKPVKTADGAEYSVAVVEVADPILGAADLKKVRVGFTPGNRRFPQLDLKAGQEAGFCLTRQPKDNLYLITNYWDVIDKKTTPDFATDVNDMKRAAKLLADPAAGLKAKDAADRQLTALMLIARYRTPRGEGKTEEVSAEESKAILTALAEGDWSRNDPMLLGNQMQPRNVFLMLGLTEQDGWKMPADFNQLPDAAQKWLKDKAGTYRIKKFVASEK